MEPCTDSADQDLTCFKSGNVQSCGGPRHITIYNGMNQFVHHNGTCLIGNLTDKLMYTVPCNASTKDQRFAETAVLSKAAGGIMLAMNPEHENKITYCITANCTIINMTAVDCAQGARIGLAPCDTNWGGTTLPSIVDPRQLWSKQGLAWKLAYVQLQLRGL